MNKEELNKCLRKLYMSAGKQDGGYDNKATLTLIRAAIDRHKNEPHNKPQRQPVHGSEQSFNSFLNTLSKSGQICSTVHKPALTNAWGGGGGKTIEM